MPATTDNNCGRLILDPKCFEKLLPFAGMSLRNLAEEHSGLIVYPPSGSTSDEADKLCIFSIDPRTRALSTGNLMGFIGIDDCELAIRSRFDTVEKDHFIYHMLARVFCPSIVDLPHGSAHEMGPDLLPFLFPGMLADALRQGVYKEYITEEHNDSRIRGRIDVPRHIRHNTPFIGNVAYNSRTLCFDNDLTQLIRHTIERLRSGSIGRYILSSDHSVIRDIDTIVECTPDYSPGALHRIVSKNLSRTVTHPYFSAYSPLQELCLMILDREMLRSGTHERKIHGILFDGAWLWEEYLAHILRPLGFEHPRNKERIGDRPLFTNDKYKRYIDFHKPGIVADAKYKRINPDQIDRDDLHQLITYIHMEKASTGLFIHPSSETRIKTIGELHGHGGAVAVLSIKIPVTDTYADFIRAMDGEEHHVRTLIGQLL